MLKNLGHSVLLMAAVALPLLTWGGNHALAQDELNDPLSFKVENFTQYDLLEFYVSPTVEPNDWGDDRLGSDTVPAGETYPITVDDNRTDCLYDVLGVFSNGQRIDEYQVDLCIDGGTYTYYDDNDVTFNVVNQTSQTLVRFYFNPSSVDEWGRDLLGDDVIPPGESAEIPIDSTECLYDFKAEFENLEEPLVEMGVDVCDGDNTITFEEETGGCSMIQTQSQKIAGLSLGLILVGSALLPLMSSGVGAALTPQKERLGNASPKAVAKPPCRRDRDRRGPCESASPSPSPSPRPS